MSRSHDKITNISEICGKIFKVVYKLGVHMTKTHSVVSMLSMWWIVYQMSMITFFMFS